MGDFNAKHTEWLPTDTTDQAGNRIKDISDSFNLTQLCSSPTHLDKTGQPCSLLDLAFTNLPDYCRSGTLPPLSSLDHLPVMVNVNLEIYTSGQSYCRPFSVRQKRNFGGKRLEKMLKSFCPSNWEWLHHSDSTDIDSLWSRWKKQFFEEIDHFIPTRSTAPSSEKSKPWFTSYLYTIPNQSKEEIISDSDAYTIG